MLSRVAHVLYWMFRYLERAQNIARFLDSDLNQLLDDPQNQGSLWHSLIATTGDRQRFEELYNEYNRKNIIRFLTLDPNYENSILTCLAKARENARTIREIISSEMWTEINSLYLFVRGASQKNSTPVQVICSSVLNVSYQIIGLFYSTMNRNEAWHYARMGMLLERADKTSRILDVKYFLLLPAVRLVGSSYDNAQWSALLKSVSGLEMYRKSYRRISPRDVIEFLVLDRNFPRSIRHCVHFFVESLYQVLNDSSNQIFKAGAHILPLRYELDYANIDQIIKSGLHEYLDRLQSSLNAVDNDIYKTFFYPEIRKEALSGHPHQSQSQN